MKKRFLLVGIGYIILVLLFAIAKVGQPLGTEPYTFLSAFSNLMVYVVTPFVLGFLAGRSE